MWLRVLYLWIVVVFAGLGLASAQASDGFGKTGLFAGLTRSNAPKFLPVEQAFSVSSTQQGQQLVVQIRVTPEHYVYQDHFRFKVSDSLTVGQPKFDRLPVYEEDPEFGRVPVYDQDVSFVLPVSGRGELSLRWQGCAKAGLCYPPQVEKIWIDAPVSTPDLANSVDLLDQTTTGAPEPAVIIPPVRPAPASHSPVTAAPPTAKGEAELPATSASSALVTPVQSSVSAPVLVPQDDPSASDAINLESTVAASQAATMPLVVTDTSRQVAAMSPVTAPVEIVVNRDPFGLAERPIWAIALLFLAGLGLAFTPCVLPMLPIVANLIARQHRRSARHGLVLSAAYVVGVASSYAILGALIALFGHQINLVAWLQQPAILLGFALIFVLLALNSFDVLPLRLPQVIRTKIERLGQVGQHGRWSGSVIGSWVVGFFSALVVSPCVSAPLAGVLLSVSTVGDPILGAAALFALGLGLGTPLIVLGATEGKLLPKGGDWLNWVRQGFGLLLLGVALYLINRVFATSWVLVLWSVLFMLLAAWMWQWQGRGQWVSRALGLLLGIWAGLQLMGAAQGGHDPWQPLQPNVQANRAAGVIASPVQATIEDLAQLQALQRNTPRLLVDVTADWCISCKIMERELFGPQAPEALQTWTRIKLDVTEPSAAAKQVLAELELFGPPALLFYQDGQLVGRLVGESSRSTLIDMLHQLPITPVSRSAN
ncbi:MAG: protein-disulfide reductase DsbD [Pseudomonadota bacterium]|nr:protein-disulfide reductase DsbD [Pseudomonadota bacterium]